MITRRLTRTAALTCLLAAAVTPAAGENAEVFHLDNGLRVLTDLYPGAGVVTVSLWAKTGSTDEIPGQEGIAHLVEHMAFKGTANRAPGAAEKEMADLGGRMNALTSFHYTGYHATVPSEHFPAALEIIADLFFNPVYDPEELAAEKQVVLREIDQLADDPQRRATLLLYRTLYRDRPYGRPVIGFAEKVAALDRDDLKDFHRQHYRPENTVLVVAGDIEAAAVREAAEKFPGSIPARDGKPSAERTPAAAGRAGAALSGRQETRETADIRSVYFRMGWPGPTPEEAAEAAALDLGLAILGRGRNSRLYRELRDGRELAGEISAGVALLPGGGPVMIRAVSEPGAEKELETAVVELLGRFLGPEGPTVEEMERARSVTLSDHLFSLETSRGRALMRGRHAASGHPDFPARYLEAVKRADTDGVRNALRRHLDPENYALAILAPEREQITGASQEPDEEAPGRRYHEARLENGLSVIFEENPALDIIALRLFFDGGRRTEDRARAGISRLTARLAGQGAGGLDRAHITQLFEALGARFNAETAPDYTVLSLEAPAGNFAHAFELLAAIVTGPDFPAVETARERRELLRQINRRRDDLFLFTYELWLENFYPAHGYGLPASGTPSAVAGIDRAALVAHHRENWRPQNAVLAITGNFNTAEKIAQTRRLLGPGTWPSGEDGEAAGQPPDRRPEETPDRTERTIARERVETNVAWLMIGFPAPAVGEAGYPALKLLNAMLGGGMHSRLFTEVREKRGLAYSVGSFYPTRLDGSHLVIYAMVEPGRLEEAKEAVLGVVAQLAAQGPDEEELERARRRLTADHRLAQETRGARAHYLAWFHLLGAGASFADGYPALLEEVSAEDTRAAAAKYLREPLFAVVGPE